MPPILLGPRPVAEPICPTCGNAPEPLAWIVHHAKNNPVEVVLWCRFTHGWTTKLIQPAASPEPLKKGNEAAPIPVITWHPDTCKCVFRYRWVADSMEYAEILEKGEEHAGLTGEEAFDQALAENQAKNTGQTLIEQTVPRLTKMVFTPDGELVQPIDGVRWEWSMVPDGPNRQAVKWRCVGAMLSDKELDDLTVSVTAAMAARNVRVQIE